MRTVYCRVCEQNLPVEAFRADRIGHNTKRDRCKKCNSAAARAWNLANPARWAASRAREREQFLARCKRYNKEHRPALTAYMRAWREKNRAAVMEIRAKARAESKVGPIIWRGSKMPPWADRAAIRKFYAEAIRLTKETGIPHEVDHIIPLKGKTVCGLHVETNLQVIPKTMNQAKRNKFVEACH